MKNSYLGNQRENIFLNNQLQNRKAHIKDRQKKEKYMYDSELIDFKDVMIFSYPAPYNKDRILHLCEKTESGKIKFYNKDIEIPISVLYNNEENVINVIDYDAEGAAFLIPSNTALEIINCDECDSTLSDNAINFLTKNFQDKKLPMIRRSELGELDQKFVNLQLAELNKFVGQNTLENFEK